MVTPLLSAVAAPEDLFTVWLDRSTDNRRSRGRSRVRPGGAVRFAFYGRISTDGYQDPASSRQWQLDIAAHLTANRGPLAVEFFDTGYSRGLAWQERPGAAELLAEAGRSDRRFDAVVIGEYERAFAGRQALQIIPHLHAYGVTVWLPEVGGLVDLADPTHRALLMILGHQAEREVLRARRRTTQAMCTQAREQGRHLGGRPPYGYRLVDAGPHPNRVHAQWGRRLHRLDPVGHRRARAVDLRSSARRSQHRRHRPGPQPTTGSVAGRPRSRAEHAPDRDGVDGKNRRGNPRQPSLHRTAGVESATHRPPRDHPGDKHTSLGRTRARNPRSEWVISDQPAHPALISDADFLAAQQVTAIVAPSDHAARSYLLTGLVICLICGRRLEGHWVHGRAGYRCRHGRSSARPGCRPLRAVYWAERRIIDELLYQLSYTGKPPFLAGTSDLLAYLRASETVIICGPGLLNLEPLNHERQATPTATIPRWDDSGGG